MTDELKRQVSAYLDDELPDAESELLVRRLCVDADLRDTLGRFALIRDAVRRDTVTVPGAFARRVHAHLDGEGGAEAADLPPARPDQADEAGAAGRRSFLRPAMAAAITGAVAVTAILSLRVNTVDPAATVADAGPVISTVPEVSEALTWTSAGVDSYTVPASMPASRMPAQDRLRLNKYLLTHNEYASPRGRQGIFPYRTVGGRLEPTREPESPREQDSATR